MGPSKCWTITSRRILIIPQEIPFSVDYCSGLTKISGLSRGQGLLSSFGPFSRGHQFVVSLQVKENNYAKWILSYK